MAARVKPIPAIGIAPLFGPVSPVRDAADRAIMAAAAETGFIIVRDLPWEVAELCTRWRALLRLLIDEIVEDLSRTAWQT